MNHGLPNASRVACVIALICVPRLFAEDANDNFQAVRANEQSSSFAEADQRQAFANGPTNESIDKNSQPIPLQRRAGQSVDSAGDNANKRDSGSFTSIISALVFVVVLIAIVLNVLKRFGGKTVGRVPDDVIEVLGHKLLNRQQTIHVIRCGSRVLILGESSASLNTLAEVTDPVEVDCLTGMCRSNGKDVSAIATFREMLRSYRSQSTNRSDVKNAQSMVPVQTPRQHTAPRSTVNAEKAGG